MISRFKRSINEWVFKGAEMKKYFYAQRNPISSDFLKILTKKTLFEIREFERFRYVCPAD